MGFFHEVVTIYNHFKDPDTERDRWIRSIVEGVQWTHGKRQITIVNGIVTEKIVESVTIDFQGNYSGRKPYLEPVEYRKLLPEEKAGYWTLDHESGLDYIILGNSGIEITKPTELKEHYQYQGRITIVKDNRNRPRLKHIKVVIE